MATQQIYSDNPGSLPAVYTLPAGLDLLLDSVVARIDGSGAAGSFLPVLEILSQDDKLVARIRPDQVFAAGDTGVVTYSPFARRHIASTTPSGGGMTRIEQQVMVGATASVTFSAIPGTYETLRVEWLARSDAAVTSTPLRMQFNGDTGTNYDEELLAGVGGTPSSGNFAAQVAIEHVGEVAGASAAAGRVVGGYAEIPGYARTVFFKPVFSHWSNIRAGAPSDSVNAMDAGVWLSTNAITSIKLLAAAGNFITGSVFTLYGIS